jgi:hypothetical protein
MPWRRLGEEKLKLLVILNIGTRWMWAVNLTLRPHFTPMERAPCTYWTGCVDPTSGMDSEVRGKIPASAGNRTPIAWSSNP